MPISWKVTIAFQVLSFGVSALVSGRSQTPWLACYFAACALSSAIWLNQWWEVSTLIRPALLCLQAVAVFDSACAMHRGCQEWAKRLRLGALWACVAMAGTVGAVEYPDFPRALFWAQLWLNVAGFVGCAALLIAFAWWPSFTPGRGSTVNVLFWTLYSAVQVGCFAYSGSGKTDWVTADTLGSGIRAVVLLLWAGSIAYTAGMFKRC